MPAALLAPLFGTVLACGGPAPAARSADSSPASSSSAAPAKAAAKPLTRSDLGFGQNVFLSSVPLQASDAAKGLVAGSTTDADFARKIRVRIEVMQGYPKLGELTRRSKVALVNGMFQLSDLTRLGSRDAPTPHDQASSFVIDYDQPSFEAPVAELEKGGATGNAASIADFAGRYITEKTYARSFDVASRVATTRAGDCSEHAVFTAALLRRFGFRARVVLGVVLVGVTGGELEGPELLAFGHAWVERYAKGRWEIVDTALGSAVSVGAPGVSGGSAGDGVTLRRAYLPINVMKDESAAFARTLMNEPGIESVLRLEVDASANRQ